MLCCWLLAGGVCRLPRACGTKLGIVNRVVPAAALDDEAMRLAQLVAQGDSFHLWMTKQMVNNALDSAGMDTHVRSGLDTWTAFRYDVRVRAAGRSGAETDRDRDKQRERKRWRDAEGWERERERARSVSLLHACAASLPSLLLHAVILFCVPHAVLPAPRTLIYWRRCVPALSCVVACDNGA
jgi:hypothetical protein